MSGAIVLDVQQGTPEWQEARLKIPTCSQFGRILMPKKLTYSAAASGYIAELLSEWATGYPMDKGSFQVTERGTDMELEARSWFELQRDVTVEQTGFLLRSDRKCGGSPDGLVGDDGILEIKCPMAHTHIGYLIAPHSLSEHYRSQAQGYLHITGRAWVDIISYHPTLPKVLERIVWDEDFQKALHTNIGRFLAELEEGRQKLVELGVKPAPSFRRQADPNAWDEAAASVASSAEVVRGMYDAREATEGEVAKLRFLAIKTDGLSVDEMLSIQHAADTKDAHAVLLWTRSLERRA